jgi:hypothetical protein
MSILDNAKQVAKAVEEIHNLELYQRVLSLHSDIIELVEENNRLRGEVKDLTGKLRVQAEMILEHPFYFRKGDANPHCLGCWDLKKEPIHLVKLWDERGETCWECPVCKQKYKVGTRRAHEPSRGYRDPGPWG